MTDFRLSRVQPILDRIPFDECWDDTTAVVKRLMVPIEEGERVEDLPLPQELDPPSLSSPR